MNIKLFSALRRFRPAAPTILRHGRFVGRARVRDAFDPMAFQFRMGAGYAGEVNRKHPFEILAHQMDATNPPTFYGQAVVIDATSKRIRRVIAGDTGLTNIYGVTVRPFPFQDPGSAGVFGAQAFGAVTTVLPNQAIDVLVKGFILVPIVTTAASLPGLGDSVSVWAAAASGAHLQGGFETASPGGSGFTIVGSTRFMGPTDLQMGALQGIGELAFNI